MPEVINSTTPLLASTLLITLLVGFIILFIILYNKVQLGFKLERQQFQQELLKTEIEIKEQTLSNVGQNLHDNVGQIAALLKINLRQIHSTPESQPKLEQSNVLIQQLIDDIKEISSSLENHQLTNFSLKEIIRKDIQRINNLDFIRVELNSTTEVSNLEINPSIFLYRMYQESINNVISHAQATKVLVSLQKQEEVLQLKIQDNGIGFDQQEERKGNGLPNLKKRAKVINATLKIKSSKEKGTTVLISLPLTSKHVS